MAPVNWSLWVMASFSEAYIKGPAVMGASSEFCKFSAITRAAELKLQVKPDSGSHTGVHCPVNQNV